MDQPAADHFRTRSPAQLTVADIMTRARREIGEVTDLPVLAVTRCARSGEGGWIVALELLESAARMGDNDLLTCYEVQFDPLGEVSGIARVGRYHREDRDRA